MSRSAWAAAVASSACALAGCNTVPIAVAKAEPTDAFPRTWDEERKAGPAASSSVTPPALAAELVPRDGAVRNPSAVAVVIGIETYRRDLPQATGAAGDARLFAGLLEKTLGVPRGNIHLMIDADATKSSIDAELDEWLPRNAAAGAETFFFFAGHGSPDPTSGTRYLVAWDSDPRFIASQGVPVDKVASRLAALKSRRTLAFVDACFSGAGGRSVLAPGTRPIVLSRVPSAAKKEPPRLLWFAAAGADEVTGAAASGNGLFSYFLARGLNGDADVDGDGAVTYAEVVDYTVRGVSDEARRQNRDQRPVVVGPRGDWKSIVLTRLPPRR